MKSVVVTGASTGIGWGCVKVLIGDGHRVFGSVRKTADGERLSKEFGDRFVPVRFDVTEPEAVMAGAAQVASVLGREMLFGLVNNAGIAVAGPLLDLPIGEFERQLAVNVTGQLRVTQAFAPLLGADRTRTGQPGRIVMMSSVAGRNAWPFLGPYSASKFALEGMSESLRRELMVFGIDVIVVGPGPIATPIWDKAEAVDFTPFANTAYATALLKIRDFMIANGRKGYPPERVGEVVKHALTAARPKVRYTVTPDALLTFVGNALPKRLVDWLVARQLQLK